jgi:hypothetical protein
MIGKTYEAVMEVYYGKSIQIPYRIDWQNTPFGAYKLQFAI